MTDKSQIQNVVFKSIDRVNEVLVDDQVLSKDSDTILIGPAAQLDSMGFVNFVVALEEVASEELGISINLAEEINAKNAAAPETMTVAGLNEFLHALLQAKAAQ